MRFLTESEFNVSNQSTSIRVMYSVSTRLLSILVYMSLNIDQDQTIRSIQKSCKLLSVKRCVLELFSTKYTHFSQDHAVNSDSLLYHVSITVYIVLFIIGCNFVHLRTIVFKKRCHYRSITAQVHLNWIWLGHFCYRGSVVLEYGVKA